MLFYKDNKIVIIIYNDKVKGFRKYNIYNNIIIKILPNNTDYISKNNNKFYFHRYNEFDCLYKEYEITYLYFEYFKYNNIKKDKDIFIENLIDIKLINQYGSGINALFKTCKYISDKFIEINPEFIYINNYIIYEINSINKYECINLTNNTIEQINHNKGNYWMSPFVFYIEYGNKNIDILEDNKYVTDGLFELYNNKIKYLGNIYNYNYITNINYKHCLIFDNNSNKYIYIFDKYKYILPDGYEPCIPISQSTKKIKSANSINSIF